eukprot:1179441-Ditylum_brightwellii.AAC.1
MTTGFSAAADYLQTSSNGSGTDVTPTGQTQMSHESYLRHSYEIADLENKKMDTHLMGNKGNAKAKAAPAVHGHAMPIQQPRK